jgi:hypothetical protein
MTQRDIVATFFFLRPNLASTFWSMSSCKQYIQIPFLSHRKHSAASLKKTNPLLLFREVLPFFSENRKKHATTLHAKAFLGAKGHY